MTLRAALSPRSIAIVGASDNPHKVGGRPILYMKRYGYRGAIYPINPGRAEVQGLKAYKSIGDVPEAPDLAVIAVAGDEAVRAVEECAARGVQVAVVMTSGFGELGAEGKAKQARMAAAAQAAGMRLVGPNCQGLANFATGAVANFSTVFHEIEARDGPVAIAAVCSISSRSAASWGCSWPCSPRRWGSSPFRGPTSALRSGWGATSWGSLDSPAAVSSAKPPSKRAPSCWGR